MYIILKHYFKPEEKKLITVILQKNSMKIGPVQDLQELPWWLMPVCSLVLFGAHRSPFATRLTKTGIKLLLQLSQSYPLNKRNNSAPPVTDNPCTTDAPCVISRDLNVRFSSGLRTLIAKIGLFQEPEIQQVRNREGIWLNLTRTNESWRKPGLFWKHLYYQYRHLE